jgi:hypothetical protein
MNLEILYEVTTIDIMPFNVAYKLKKPQEWTGATLYYHHPDDPFGSSRDLIRFRTTTKEKQSENSDLPLMRANQQQVSRE